MLAVTRLGGEGAEASDDRGLLFGRGLRLELEDDDMDVGRHAGAAAGVPGRAAPGNGVRVLDLCAQQCAQVRAKADARGRRRGSTG